MKIAFNPSTVAALTAPPNNKDITFDLRGRNIFARGVKFYGTDTNTWRDIKINNVSIGSHTLDLRNGSNTTLTNTNGIVTINSTWRPVVDNLTSDSTTSSLSAKQGKVLKALIDGKSNSDHNHDGRYVRKSGDTMSGVLIIDTTNFGALAIKRSDDVNGASIQFRGKSNIYGYIGFNAANRNKQLLRWNGTGSQVYTILDTSSTYISSGKGIINGTTITQVDNATNATNSTNARKLVNWYSARPTSLNAQFGDGSLRIFHATSSTTEGKPAEDSHILHLAWDNTGGWDAQLAVHLRSGKVSTRAQNGGTWQPWKTLAFTTDIPSSLKNPHSFNVFGVTYDGSAAKTVTTSTFISQVNEGISTITDGTMLITSYASNSGFADTNAVNVPYKRRAIHLWEYIKTKTDSLYTVIGHTHDDRYLRLIGGTMTGTINRRSGGSTISGRDHAIIRQTYAPGGSSWNPIACVDTETGTWTLGHLSHGDSDTNFHFCFSTNADYNAGNNNGNYVTLRNRVGTIALTSEIPSKGSWNYDDRYYTKAESNAKYITDITTSVNKLTFTRNGSNIDRTITVNNVQSLGKRSPLTERNAISGIYTYGTYSATDNLAPTNYFETLGFGEGTAGAIEIGGSWISSGQLYWRALRDVQNNWFSWKTILDSSNYSDILDSRYYTESEVNSLLSKKLDRVNLSVGTWNPRGYNLAADYCYNGGDLSISENGGKMYVSIDGYFWQNEGQYRVLDISDVAGLKSDLTIHQYLSATDATWWPLIWGGDAHNNTSDSTGAVYKSHDKLSWQTSSQTLYATNIQTENIKRLSIGGGIYWNPCVESTTDDTDAASITLVKSGVAGGTTLVLSQLNDANDTIQFQTNGAAKLYHNSYPILTTQNTYVNNRKGYIYGTEITQVNNSDTVDGRHYNSFAPFNGVKFSHGPDANIWHRILQFTTNWVGQVTFMYSPEECQRSYWGIFNINIRSKDIEFRGFSFADVPQIKCIGDDNNNWSVWIKGGANAWNPYGVIQVLNQSNASIVSVGLDKSQTTEPSGTYNKAPSLFYAGFTDWNNITNKPSTFNPAAHTHTVFRNNLMIKGTNGISDSASIHLGIGDSDTGFKWVSDGVCQIYADNAAIGQWTGGGMNWFRNPTVNGNKVWNAGNDGFGSGLDADLLDGQHADKYIMVPTTIDASTLDINTYYPVTIWLPTKNTRIEVEVSLDSGTKPSWSTHNSGFTTRKVWESNGSGWGTTSIERNIFVSVYSFALEDPVRGIGQLTNSSIEYVYVRGGGKYFFKVSVGSGTPTLQKATYTTNNQSIAPTKTAPALITPCINTPHKNVTLWGQNFNGTNNVSGSLINTGTITPAAANVYNIGTSGNFYNTIYSRVLCGETSNTSVYHQIAIGYPGHDRMDFDEYGGAFYFNKTSSASRYTVATITSGGLYTTNAVTYGLNGLQYFNQVTGTTSGATNNANPYNDWFHIIRMNHGNGSGYFVDLATAFHQDAMYFRRIVSGQDKGWRKILHDGNSSISGDTITINGSSLTVSKSDHNHDGRYAISENYGGFTRTGRLPISGFYQSYESTSGGNAPWTSWMHLINCQHSNINNNYALQIAASFYDNNTFKIRVTNDNVNNAWKNIIHSGNIGAQSVNYANSAGNADKVDGYHATDGRTFNGDINWGSWNDTWSDGTNKHPWYGFDHRYPNTGAYSTTITDYFGMTIKTANTLRLDFRTLLLNGTSIYDINVASATNAYHLRINSANSWSTWYWAGQGGQPTWLWGSNDGTNMYVWNPSNFNVNTAQYLRSLGNQNCQTGRTQNYGNIYSYNTRDYNTGAPESYTSVIGFGRGAEGTVEIAGGWCNSNLHWRSLRDVSDNWYSWRTVLDSSNYTNFINNYYWANIKISTSANTQTTPSVNTIYANNWFRSQGASGWYSESYGGGINMSDTTWIRTYGNKSFYCDRQIYSSSSIRMSDILLERTNEINNITNGPLHLNYRNTGNVTLCNGGGAVTIGTTSTDIGGNKLFVNGSEFIDGASNVRQHVFAKGFRHRDHNSNDAVLLAGGGYSQGVPVKYWAIYSIYIGGSSTDNSYYKLSGNYNFISNMTWEQLGSAILNINFPSGYNKGNTLIFGNGDHMMNTNWSTPVYVTITTHRRFGQASNIRVMISDDSSFNTGFASIYFMCMG